MNKNYTLPLEDNLLQAYMRDLNHKKHDTISPTEELKIANQIKKAEARGDQVAFNKACKELVGRNLRFVVSVAKNYQNQGLPLIDLINTGNLGLIRAARKFEPAKNFKFISYAVWWIRQSILMELANQSRMTRQPLNRVTYIYKARKAFSQLQQRLHRDPTMKEVAEHMKVPMEDLIIARTADITPMLLNSPNAAGRAMINYIKDESIEQPDEIVEERSFRSSVKKELRILPERDQKIVNLYFGLEGDTTHTLEEIGSMLNITRERVRQIKDEAMKVLKGSKRFRALRENLG